MLISDVWTTIHPDSGDQGVAGRRLEALIRHQDRGQVEAFRGAEYEIFHLSWRRIRVDPDLQGSSIANLRIGLTTPHKLRTEARLRNWPGHRQGDYH